MLKLWPEAKHGSTPRGWGLTEKKKSLCFKAWLQHVTAADNSRAKEGVPPPGLDPPRCLFCPDSSWSVLPAGFEIE